MVTALVLAACRQPKAPPRAGGEAAPPGPGRLALDATIGPAEARSGPAAPARPLVCGPGRRVVWATAPLRRLECQDGAGVADGPFIAVYPDGDVRVRGQRRSGQLDGEYVELYPGGAVRLRATYRAGQLDGEVVHLGPNGQPWATEPFAAGTGVMRTFWPDGSPARISPLRAGRPDGESVVRDVGGVEVVREAWVDGVRTGPRLIGTRTRLAREERWRAGVPVGPQVTWRQGARVVEEQRDGRGLRHGSYTSWRTPRQRREHGSYLHGERDGVWTWWDRDGAVERTGTYRAGVRVGTWTEASAGVRTWLGTYHAGKLDGEVSQWSPSGAALPSFRMQGGTGVEVQYHPRTGTVAARITWRAGRRDGAVTELFPRGRTALSGRHQDDQRAGTWTWFHADGSIRQRASYQHDRRDGVLVRTAGAIDVVSAGYADGARDGAYRERHPDGSLAVIGRYAGDRRSGVWWRCYPGQVLAEPAAGASAPPGVAVEEHWRDGQLDGAWLAYDRSGRVITRGQFAAGRRVGRWIRYRPDGAELAVDEYWP
jgi:antitoxin component YwqK of YwqJK toxin-antitoxin module